MKLIQKQTTESIEKHLYRYSIKNKVGVSLLYFFLLYL